MRNLVPWKPFKELANIEDIFDRFFGPNLFPHALTPRLWRDGLRSPAIDVYEQKDRLVVKAELPGIDKKDVKIKVDGDMLSIEGETKKEQEVNEKNHYYSERYYGSFYRNIPLPAAVHKDKAKATYKDGILTIDLPKTKETKPKETEIQIQ